MREQNKIERERRREGEVQEQGQTFRWSVTRGQCGERKSTGAVSDLHTLAFSRTKPNKRETTET